MGIDHLLEFLGESVTAFHAAAAIVRRLEAAGFRSIDESKELDVEPGSGYYIRRGDASVVAFRMGRKPPSETGFAIAGAHTDSPSLRVKYPATDETEGYRTLPIEIYGGPIVGTWLDRSLGLAGRVVYRGEDGRPATTLIASGRPVGTIPNAAIHLNREVNKGFEYNQQDHLKVIVGSDAVEPAKLIAELAGVAADTVIDADLYFYDVQSPERFGTDGEFFTAGRIDNLAGCFTVLEGLLSAAPSDHCQLACLFDNEEVGSRTAHGADSGFLTTVMDRLVLATGGGLEQTFTARARSFLVSNDGAHAVHPNYASKHDPSFKPSLNGGPVIKISGGRRYTSDAVSSARFAALCDAADVPYQRFYNRSDMRSGSTIGPIASSRAEILSVDVGVPMLAMHSIRETGGSKDADYLATALRRFYVEGPRL